MWFWKKPKPEDKTSTPRDKLVPPPMMGIVAHPIPPRPEKPKEPEKLDDPPKGTIESGPPAPGDWSHEDDGGEAGTSRAARSVRARMEPNHAPRPNSFDPSKVAPSSLISLQSIAIATPCRADWSKMEGDDKSRFCQTCQKSVYNLSAMTTPEAQALIEEKAGNLCARIYRRADGTVITGDCPVGKSAPRRAFWGAGLAAIFGALLSGCGSNASRASSSSSLDSLRNVPVLGAVINLLSPEPQAVAGGISITVPNGDKPTCPVPTPAPKPTAAPKEEVPRLMGAVASMAAQPVLGRIARPRPTATPTSAPEMGEPTMGKPMIARSKS